MKEEKNIRYDDLAGLKIKRNETLSDSVFAIAMTILVLEVRMPAGTRAATESDLFTQFLNFSPTLLSYLMSFMTLGIYWIGHSLQYSYIEKSDRNLSWISIFYLMFITLLPFTTAFLSDHIDFKFSILLYWLNMFIAGILVLIHWIYAYNNKLVKESAQNIDLIDKLIRKRIYFSQGLYFFAAMLCFLNIYFSIIAIILIQLNFAFAFRYNRLRRAKLKKNILPVKSSK